MSGTRVATIGNNLLLFVQTVWEVMKICYGGHFSTLLSCFIVYWRHQLYLLIPIYRAVQTLARAILLSLPWPTGQPKNHQVATSTNVYLNFGHFTHTFKTINHCLSNYLFVWRRQTYIYCICHSFRCSIFYTIYRPDCWWPYNFAAEPPLNTGHKLAPDRGSAAEGWENCTYFVFVPSALHRQQKRNHTIWWFDRISSVADDGATTMHQQQQQQQQHRLSLGRNYPGGGRQCQQRWRSPAVRWCCGRCCCAAVVPSGHASHCSGHVGTCFPPHCI